MRPRDLAAITIALLLTFAVGFLAGRSCAPTVEVPGETITVTAPGPERIVYQCPPDAGVGASDEPQVRASAPKPAPKQKGAALPAAPPPITPLQRKQLLSWVRDQSVDLEGCRGGARQTYRVSVTLGLDDGRVKSVRFNAPPDELPDAVRSCFERRMMTWSPPKELVEGRRELLFLLTL